MIELVFPDGATRSFEAGVTGRAIAEQLSKSLSKKAVLVELDGKLLDLERPLEKGGRFRIITRDDDDPIVLETLRHDAAHVLAEAVQELFPGTQVTIGPSIENGFFYDFYRNQPFTPEDFPGIKKKMREIIRRDKPFTKSVTPSS